VLVLLVTTIRLSTTILFYLGNGQDRTIIIKPNVHVELLFLQLTASITTKSQTTFAILPHTCISQQTSPRFPQQTSPTRHTANLAPMPASHSKPRPAPHSKPLPVTPQQISPQFTTADLASHTASHSKSHTAPHWWWKALMVSAHRGWCPCLPVCKLFLPCRRRSKIAGAGLSLYAHLISHFNITNIVI